MSKRASNDAASKTEVTRPFLRMIGSEIIEYIEKHDENNEESTCYQPKSKKSWILQSVMNKSWNGSVMSSVQTAEPIRDGIVYSPCPDCEVPRCSMYADIKECLLKLANKTVMIEGENNVSSSELLKNFERYAAGFQSHGITKSDRVICLLSNGLENFTALYSLIFAGGVALLADPDTKKGELLYMAQNSEATCVLTDVIGAPNIKELLKEVKFKGLFIVGDVPGFTSVSKFSGIPAINFRDGCNADPENEIAAVCYSSGTTGSPKAMEITHYAYVSCLVLYGHANLFEPSDVFLVCEPMSHSFGLILTMFAVCSGVTAVVLPSPPGFVRLSEAITRNKVTIMCGFPAMLDHIATQMKESGRTFPSVKKIICTGGSVSRALQALLLHQFKLHSFRNLYGLSEGLASLTYTPANEICFDNIGFPGCNIRIKVIDRETGISLGPGNHGELCVQTPSIIKGYSRKGQEPLPAVDDDGWLHTGDLGFYDDGGCFHYVERLKNIIKCFDYNVEPNEIEAVLLQHPGVAEAVVVGTPHPVFYEAPTAFVVRTKDLKSGASVTEDELKEYIAEQLMFYKHLHGGVYIVDTIARTANGKISREQMKHHLNNL